VDDDDDDDDDNNNNNNNNNVSVGVLIKNLILQFPPCPSYFLPVIRPEYLPYHPFSTSFFKPSIKKLAVLSCSCMSLAKSVYVCMTSGFSRGVNGIFPLLGCYAA